MAHTMTTSPSISIKEARDSDAPEIAYVLQEAAQWLAGDGRAHWSPAEIGIERVLRDASAGLFYLARQGEQLAGVEHALNFSGVPTFAWTASRTGKGCETSMRTSASPCTASCRKGASRMCDTSSRRQIRCDNNQQPGADIDA